MKRDYDYFFKFVLIGDTCIGKSCLLVRFAVSIYLCGQLTYYALGRRFRRELRHHHRCRLQIQNSADQQEHRQTTDLGYSWTGEI